jgi:hypothetical protein
MRAWVAHNKTVPLEILEALVYDPSADVRHAVAMKNKLSPQLLLLLASDEDESVRLRVAHNRNATIDSLRKLAADKSVDVSEVAKKRLADSEL